MNDYYFFSTLFLHFRKAEGMLQEGMLTSGPIQTSDF